MKHIVKEYKNVALNQVIENPFGVSDKGRVKAEGGGTCTVAVGVYVDGDETNGHEFEQIALDSSKNWDDAVAYFGQAYNYLKVLAVNGTVHLVVQDSKYY